MKYLIFRQFATKNGIQKQSQDGEWSRALLFSNKLQTNPNS